ncbi:hypothetical protein NDU88_000753 [Pleurodeles waltl]|uniref:Uncharacterized protein n=1 Tax=Pleurodeles waltl TaxID=8319 RepID=A0AAV7L7H4_PLEWA|nr:hypothetical protein NDU88_000753 [Pleurodeles waltl]
MNIHPVVTMEENLIARLFHFSMMKKSKVMSNKTKQNSVFLMLNGNSIQKKTDKLLHLMESKDVSVVLISETHLQGNHKLDLANHKVYRTDHSTGAKARRTAVVISTEVKHHENALPPVGSIEATGIQIQTSGVPLCLIAGYSPPNQLCPSDMDALPDSNMPTSIGGDLFAKHQCWNPRTANSKGHALLAHSRKKDFVVAGPTHPKYYRDAIQQKLDVLDKDKETFPVHGAGDFNSSGVRPHHGIDHHWRCN